MSLHPLSSVTPEAAAFDYEGDPYPVRPDLVEAYRAAWADIAQPGSWWTGPQRVAIAHEVRKARSCALCAERKAALSPFAVGGDHDTHALLPPPAVDTIHRLTTDASRLTKSWLDGLERDGLSNGAYVELLGVVVAVTSIDAFHDALGTPLEPLPIAIDGDPTSYRPEGLVDQGAWVPMLSGRAARGPEADLYDGLPIAANVIAAMSLVPDAVRLLKTLSIAQYLPFADVANPAAAGNRAISRAQIELVAGRVSALNECFY